MSNPAGEMPFLDHLEELRKRILLSLVAIMAGFGLGYWLTTHYELIKLVEKPVQPFIPGGKLTVLTLTDPFMIVLKFAFILGVVLASPFVIYQVWLFLSPALTSREKRAVIPSLAIGFVLFASGVIIGWVLVVPPGVEWLATYQLGTFTTQFTYDSYMRLVVHLLIGMGISAELPLVMILLASLNILSYRIYTKVRRYAVLASFVGGAILAPTPEVSMMILFTIPLLLLYEVGVAGAWLVERRRARAARIAAAVLLIVLCVPRGLHAQVPPPAAQGPPGAQALPGGVDTSRRVTGQGVRSVDTSQMKRLGLPSAPSYTFAQPDAIMQALLSREGFASTRYRGDSVRYVVSDGEIELDGHAATLRSDGQLEADHILYANALCEVIARGQPRMFNHGQQPVIAYEMHVKICTGAERGVLDRAYTSLAQGGTNWFMRGNLAIDSSGRRLFGAHTEFTSCDLPDPHYHFDAGKVKWMSQSMIVARPAVLYIRDVPVAWLPFIFQDTKRDRSSGILIPRFGFNDIVRTDKNYNRTVSNIGYYWAPNDYMDATVSMDWYANRYTQYTGSMNYRWLNQFMNGSVLLSKQIQSDGVASNTLHWDHRQSFNATTQLNFFLNYVSNSSVQLANAIDPLASTQSISSSVNFAKRLSWGSITAGATRSQTLGTGTGTMTLPSLVISPKAVQFGPNVLWSPTLNLTNTTGFNNPLVPPTSLITAAGVDTLSGFTSSRVTSIDFNTPITFFSLSFQNRVRYNDQELVGRTVTIVRIPDPTPGAAPGDSVSRATVTGGNYLSSVDWDPAIGLPQLARGTWNLTPSIGVGNILASSSMMIRSPESNGGWVSQGKKLRMELDAAPTFFGFMGGIGPYGKFRYTLAPVMSMAWSPKATVSPEFARASAVGGVLSSTDVPATMLGTISFHQEIVGKVRQAASDTNTDPKHLAKVSILSIATSPISYDFEQAKLPHQTGWTTSALTNTFTSALIPALSLSTTHSLWDGPVGTDSARFSPFLSAANMSLQLSGGTFRSIGRLLGLVHKDSVPNTAGPSAAAAAAGPGGTTAAGAAVAPLLAGSAYSPQRSGSLGPPPARGLSMTLNFTLNRTRPNGTTAQPVSTEPVTFGSVTDPLGIGSIIPITTPPAQSQIGLTMSFAPTTFWSVSWNTQYDITHSLFESQNIVLQRDLHDWRASFTFTKNTNGNFALYFTVFLLNLPDIKFDYNQTTLQQTPVQPIQP